VSVTVKFAVGYQLAEGDETPFSEIVKNFRENISEVYFPWMDMASGRSQLVTRHGHTDWSAQSRLEAELFEFKNMGMKIDLLLNGNCYGRISMSEELQNKVLSILEHLEQLPCKGADIVTTTSPFIAHVIKRHFPSIEVRASVNMRIGTIKGMQYVSDVFDSFYVQREHNRNLNYIRELKDWCNNNGKGLYMLANSGCLNYCSGQSFHDNMVAHEYEICETVNVKDFMPYTCWKYLKKRENWQVLLQNSWVRPEDIHNYEGLFKTVKLATRMHALPGMVIQAYTSGSYYGNILDLCEPGFGPAISPYIIDNKLLPQDFFERVSTCDKNCTKCSYCGEVLNKALVECL